MSFVDYFTDWKTSATVQTLVQTPDSSGHMVDSFTNGATISGVLHTASANEAYFGRNWATDVTKIFKSDVITGLTPDKYLLIDSIRYAVSDINNVNEQGLVYVVGLKVHV